MNGTCQTLSTIEFSKRWSAALVNTAHGGPPIGFGCGPASEGRVCLLMRVHGNTFEAFLDGPRPADFDQARGEIINADRAYELMAAWCDWRIADELANARRKGQKMPQRVTRASRLCWHDVPVSFAWVACPDGRHMVLARNAGFAKIEPAEWYELAAHPSEYGDIWKIQPDSRGWPGGTLHLAHIPSLEKLARLHVIDDRLWAERQAHEQQLERGTPQ